MKTLSRGLLSDPSNPNKAIRPPSAVRFSDVAGVDASVLELSDVVSFLKSPSRYHKIGARPPRGVLLHGPSGTGKTLLARAIAGEAGVPFLAASASDFVEMLVGRGAARVRDLFDRARTAARDKAKLDGHGSDHPSDAAVRCAIVFIDEIDALAKSRGSGFNSNDEREQTLNQLLTEMDGFESREDEESSVVEGAELPVHVFVLAATNRPEILDAALLRPGRFDRIVEVGPPDRDGREKVLRLHAKKVRHEANVDFKKLARECADGFTGADLCNLVNEAALLAVREGKDIVSEGHFTEARKRTAAMRLIL